MITAFFTHEGFWHIFWNMIALYWFGEIFIQFLGQRKLYAIYILGGLAGNIAYFVLAQFFYFGPGALGASAAVFAIIVAAPHLCPTILFIYSLIGPVKLKYIALVYVILAFFGLRGVKFGWRSCPFGGRIDGFCVHKATESRFRLEFANSESNGLG